jgi:hypothetical protein
MVLDDAASTGDTVPTVLDHVQSVMKDAEAKPTTAPRKSKAFEMFVFGHDSTSDDGAVSDAEALESTLSVHASTPAPPVVQVVTRDFEAELEFNPIVHLNQLEY